MMQNLFSIGERLMALKLDVDSVMRKLLSAAEDRICTVGLSKLGRASSDYSRRLSRELAARFYADSCLVF
jgi:hypothetical protein